MTHGRHRGTGIAADGRARRGRLVACLALGVAGPAFGAAPGLPPSEVSLRVNGADLVDDTGKVVHLRAVNLGNWLLLESWMYAQTVEDQATFISVLRARFGDAAADHLLGLHRAGWMTQRDFDAIAAAGFNSVRVPVSHVVLESSPFVLDEAGFAVLESAFEMAAAAGLYVVLDMHSVPGGQSIDQPSGDVTANELWVDEQAQERLAWLWQHIARRFKNTSNFVAYDLINEPYSDYSTDVRDELVEIVDRCVRAIREIDPDRLILAPAALQGIRFYGDPADRGWTNTGFTEHFYPGVFDWRAPTMGEQARFLASIVRDRAEHARSLGVPFFLGEFNPVFDRAGAPNAVRETLDFCEAVGAHAAVWSYKLVTAAGGVGNNNWYLATNAQPLGLGGIRTASYNTIESVFGSLGTMPLVTDLPYLESLTADPYSPVLPAAAWPPVVAPAQDAWSPWSAVDLGEVARPGGQAVLNGAATDADRLTIYAAGQDLCGTADSLRLVSRTTPSSFVVSGVFDAFEGDQYAQAGVTIRTAESANSPHLSLLVQPDGRVLVKSRGGYGWSTGQRSVAIAGFPVGLALGRSGGAFVGWVTDADGVWTPITISENPSVGASPRAGFFGLANREGPLSEIEIEGPTLGPVGVLAPPPTLDAGSNLLLNPSFETASGPAGAADWSLWSSVMTREAGWTPVRDGSALLAYRHWQAGSGDSGAYQDVLGLTPGQAYVLTVYANRDTVAPGRSLADRVELRVETVETPARHLEAVEHDVEQIATGSAWSRLQLRFVATQTRHRVMIIAYPASGNRDGAVKFDGLMLEADPG